MQKLRLWTKRFLLFLAVLGFAYFIWPGRYEYYPMQVGPTRIPYLIRRDRITGKLQVQTPMTEGWAEYSSH